MSEDTGWIAEYASRSAAARSELKRAVLACIAEERRRRDAEAAKRRRAGEQDRREWTDGIRRRLGLVAEVHECKVWQIGERWWAWACKRPGCPDADWQHTANSEATRAAAWAKASAHARRYRPSPPQPAPGAGLDLTGFGHAREP